MPRPLWAGAISFGLVTIPVKVVSATEDHDVHFHRVHLADMGRVRTRKVCELDDQVVSQDEIGKGYEVAKDRTVPVTDEELEQMPLPTAKAIEIAAFTDARQHRSGADQRLLRPGRRLAGSREALRAAAQGAGAVLEGRGGQVRVARP